MSIAHLLLALSTYAKPADDCLLYNTFLPTLLENLHREYFLLTTMNLHEGNAPFAVFALRQGDSCTICDSLVQCERCWLEMFSIVMGGILVFARSKKNDVITKKQRNFSYTIKPIWFILSFFESLCNRPTFRTFCLL